MEYIVHNRWKTLADAEYSDKNPVLPPNGSTVFVHMDHIYPFFKEVEKTDNQYVLISADSDYCLSLQSQHPVWLDMRKWFNFVPLEPQMGYSPIVLPSRCQGEFCKIDDTFSIKVYSFTKATFDRIPENIIRWYATNIDFDCPGIEHIPFGVPEWNLERIDKLRGQGKHEDGHGSYREHIYVNFQSNTVERNQLKNTYKTFHKAWYVDKEVSHDEYVDHLFEMKYVLSPPGNGYDCFRTLEAIYCGAIPILLDSPFNAPYKFLNTIFSPNMMGWPDREWTAGSLDGTNADFAYWRERIGKVSKNLKETT